MKRLLFILIALTCFTISSKPALACTCAEVGAPVCAAYWTADAVFVGLLRDITPPDHNSVNRGSLPRATLHFIVEQPFRGITTATVDVGTFSGTSCDMGFAKGIRYLIYAHRESETNQLFAGPCSRTTSLQHADEDLNYIRSLTQQGVRESIAGRVARMRFQPVAGVKIEVRNGGKNLETTSDEQGNFSISLGGPGKYDVKVLIPSAVEVLTYRKDLLSNLKVTDDLTTLEYTVELGKSQCDYREFDLFPVDLHATAEISGNVLTASGRAVNKGYVYLMNASDSSRYTQGKIEANGSFKFEGVAAGEYFLVLNPRNEAPDDDDPPYARAYYPNATDESGATKIVVTEGARLENLTLRVGPAWKARTVSGRVVWPDGSPVPEAHVSLYDSDRYLQLIKVDKKGRFSFPVYGDFKYAIEAKVWGERPGESDRVAITDKTTNLTVVLKRK